MKKITLSSETCLLHSTVNSRIPFGYRVSIMSSIIIFVMTLSVIFTAKPVKAEEQMWSSKEIMEMSKSGKNISSARKTEPEEWNLKEIKAYKFAGIEEAMKYMLISGVKYYNQTYFSAPYKIKVKVVESGALSLMMTADNEKNGVLYDQNMNYIQRIPSTGFVKVDARAGEYFYVEFPANAKEGIITACVLENQFQGLKNGAVKIQKGTGNFTRHAFQVKRRSRVCLTLQTINGNAGRAEMYLQKKSKGTWKKIGKKRFVSGDGANVIYGLSPGSYRLMLKSDTKQGVFVLYDRTAVKKKVSYKASKAKNLKVGKTISNLYTTGEQAARWHQVSVTTKKKQRKLKFTVSANQGGFQFKIYKEGSQKPYKIVRLAGERSKTFKLPRKICTYKIRVSKISKKTNGTYKIKYK